MSGATPSATPPPPVWLLAAMPAMGAFASSIYLPSMPAMAVDLQVPVDQVQLSVTAYLAAMASCMLLVGPLSDRLGRRKVAMVTLTAFFIGSLAALCATSVGMLIAARLVQGLGASGGIVLARSMLRDSYADLEVAKASGTMSMSVSVAPLLAPLVGGYVQEHLGWRANLLIIALMAAAVGLLALKRLPETLLPEKRQLHRPLLSGLLPGYWRLLRLRPFMAHALPVAFGAAAAFAYQTEAPVLLIAVMHLPPSLYGYYGALPSLGFFAGAFIVRHTAGRLSRMHLIDLGLALFVTAGLLMAGLAAGLPPAPWAVAAPMLLFGLGNGMLLPSASVGGMNADLTMIGFSAALSSSMRMAAGSTGSLLVTAFPGGSALWLGGLIAGMGLLAFALWRVLSKGLSR